MELAPARAWDLRSESGLGENMRIWDQHAHLGQVPGDTPEERMAFLVKCMDRVGVERLILSQGYSDDQHPNPAEQFRLENDRVMRAVKAFPDRAYGSGISEPGASRFQPAGIESLCARRPHDNDRRDRGGRALQRSAKWIPSPSGRSRMKLSILQHEWLKTGGNEPDESTPFDVVELAKRHPRLQIVCAHTGGNWELGIRAIRATKNVYCGLAGSDPTAGYVEMAVRELGAERVIFGSDVGGRSFASQIAKVEGANIPESDKKLILGGNLRRLLAPMLRKKGYKV